MSQVIEFRHESFSGKAQANSLASRTKVKIKRADDVSCSIFKRRLKKLKKKARSAAAKSSGVFAGLFSENEMFLLITFAECEI